MTPTIGRVVHYVHPDTGAHMPALVLSSASLVGERGEIALRAFGHTAADDTFAASATHDPEGTIPGSWHWPEREGEPTPANATPRSPAIPNGPLSELASILAGEGPPAPSPTADPETPNPATMAGDSETAPAAGDPESAVAGDPEDGPTRPA